MSKRPIRELLANNPMLETTADIAEDIHGLFTAGHGRRGGSRRPRAMWPACWPGPASTCRPTSPGRPRKCTAGSPASWNISASAAARS